MQFTSCFENIKSLLPIHANNVSLYPEPRSNPSGHSLTSMDFVPAWTFRCADSHYSCEQLTIFCDSNSLFRPSSLSLSMRSTFILKRRTLPLSGGLSLSMRCTYLLTQDHFSLTRTPLLFLQTAFFSTLQRLSLFQGSSSNPSSQTRQVHHSPRGSDGSGALSMRLSLDREIEAVQSFTFKVTKKALFDLNRPRHSPL